MESTAVEINCAGRANGGGEADGDRRHDALLGDKGEAAGLLMEGCCLTVARDST